MKFKIDTKEKMHVITLEEAFLSGNMTVALNELLLSFQDNAIKNIVIKMDQVKSIDEQIATQLATIQQAWYEKNNSMVFCNLQKEVEELLESMELLEVMNITPTESEAWDIVQMEEIEREYL